jgi:DNA replication and repair protein RecF
LEVRRVELTSFRSYERLELAFPAGPQVLFGANAAGKTNLLEALVVLGSGRSHRTSTEAELITWEQPFARLEAEARSGEPGDRGTEARSDVIELTLARQGAAAARKRVRVNGVARRAAALADALRVVVFAPEEMLLVVGSPSLRRAAIDSLAAQRWPLYRRALTTYGRALQQRNSLLRIIREGLAEADQLRYWDDVLVTEGGSLVAQRLELLEELSGPLAEAHAEIAPGEGGLSVSYLTNAPTEGAETPADALRRRLAETAEKELWNGATLVGPHRDDLAFAIDGRELATFASRGQQRTAILALKLAELDLLSRLDGRPPLLLLDDVFSELDPARRSHLVRRVSELPQAFITTTALEDLDQGLVRSATTWRVRPGVVEPVAGP